MTNYHVRLFEGGLADVRCRVGIPLHPRLKHVILRLSGQDVRSFRCDTSDHLRTTTVKLGRNVTVLVEPEQPSTENATPAKGAEVTLSYRLTISIEPWNADSQIWRLTRYIFPRSRTEFNHPKYRVKASTHNEDEVTEDQIELTVAWNPERTKVFGLPSDPAGGTAHMRLSQPEMADLQVYFGALETIGTLGRLTVWAPVGRATRLSGGLGQRVLTYATRVRGLLSDVFGAPTVPVEHIVLAPRTVTAQFSGTMLLIRDPRDNTGKISAVGDADLIAQLAHELSHSWWVPVSIPFGDARVWSIVEGIAVLSEFLALTQLLVAQRQAQVLALRRAHHSDLVTRRVEEHVSHYRSREAASGLRLGYVFIALLSQGTKLGDPKKVCQSLLTGLRRGEAIPQLLQAAFGRELGEAMTDIAQKPQSPMASLRYNHVSEETVDVTVHFKKKKQASDFLRLLKVSEVLAGQLRDTQAHRRRVFLSLVGATAVDSLQHLTPGFMVDRRVVQWNRMNRSKALRSLSETAWRLRAEKQPISWRARISHLVVGFLEIILESEAAIGFELIADGIASWPSLADRFRKAAKSRAEW